MANLPHRTFYLRYVWSTKCQRTGSEVRDPSLLCLFAYGMTDLGYLGYVTGLRGKGLPPKMYELSQQTHDIDVSDRQEDEIELAASVDDVHRRGWSWRNNEGLWRTHMDSSALVAPLCCRQPYNHQDFVRPELIRCFRPPKKCPPLTTLSPPPNPLRNP